MSKIVVTGAAGFIGCNLARRLNREGFSNLILVDDFSRPEKQLNLEMIEDAALIPLPPSKGDFTAIEKIERSEFLKWFEANSGEVEFVFHLGARTDTTEQNRALLDELNLHYTQAIWRICTSATIPLIYASSAATYGAGENGFSDDHELLPKLHPLNPYGDSKHEFDLLAIAAQQHPPFWAGLKFFNVYGPYEFHKGRMASVIFHAYHQVKEQGRVKLFKSHRDDFHDGEQLRDFVCVEDVVDICYWMMMHYREIDSGIYNIGSGKARSFNDLVSAVFAALEKPVQIDYIDIPEDIREKYQYFTEAEIEKLRSSGFDGPFHPLEEGVHAYVKFLEQH